MSQQSLEKKLEQRWSWPNKTWFQERLALVRARERKLYNKPLVQRAPVSVATRPAVAQDQAAPPK